jgi:ion channel-forming bestrophin family protein
MRKLHIDKLIDEYFLIVLSGALDELARLQGALKRMKSYPYARNYYSIAVFLVMIFVAIIPFGLFPYAQDLGKSTGVERWTSSFRARRTTTKRGVRTNGANLAG